jgi:hypothetical protein
MTTTTTITISDYNCALYYMALGKAIIATEALLKRKSAAMFSDALALELSAYKAEQARIAETFPRLKEKA